jgi:hypothetical protein
MARQHLLAQHEAGVGAAQLARDIAQQAQILVRTDQAAAAGSAPASRPVPRSTTASSASRLRA